MTAAEPPTPEAVLIGRLERSIVAVGNIPMPATETLLIDALAFIRAQAAALAGAEQWQDIASAPKDGSEIVLVNMKWANRHLVAVRWNAEHNRFENGSGHSTGLRDDIAWTHWTRPPAALSQPPASDRDEKAPPRAADMSSAEIAAELSQLETAWDAFRHPDFEGHSGSPGEWLVERMDELNTEVQRRLRPTPTEEQPQ